jgi:hypothetical protein
MRKYFPILRFLSLERGRCHPAGDESTTNRTWNKPGSAQFENNQRTQEDKIVMMIPVNSTAIRAVGYDGYILAVLFWSGRVYNHPGVPEWVFHELMDATSKGGYYTRRIRGRYR